MVRLFSRSCSGKTWGKGFKLKEEIFSASIRKKNFYNEAGKHGNKDVQRSRRCPTGGNIHGQTGESSKKPYLVKMTMLMSRRLD